MRALAGVILSASLGAVITPLAHDSIWGANDDEERQADIKVGAVVGAALAIITWPFWRRR